MRIDHFAHKAQQYEQNPRRVDNVLRIARAIREENALTNAIHIVDFESGTGLLLAQLASDVGHITAIDISPAMNAQLRQKQPQLPCTLDILEIDLAQIARRAGFQSVRTRDASMIDKPQGQYSVFFLTGYSSAGPGGCKRSSGA